MKKIILSAAVAAMAFSTSAFAADKGIDIDVSGQAVLYYETHSDNATGDKGQLDQDNSVASAGIQLNLGSDLGNNFTFGSQITYLGSLGLAQTTVATVKQTAGTEGTTTAELALTKIFIAKQIANTTLKMGRQELPKSLSPLAFSEGWTVYKNTFDAVIAVNTDLPKTTVVGAYVTGTSGLGLGTMTNLVAQTDNFGKVVGSTTGAFMLTAQTKLIPMTTLTLSYYVLNNALTEHTLPAANTGGTATLTDVDVNAYWADAQIAPKDAPLGLKLALQAGKLSPDSHIAGNVDQDLADTSAYGAKISAKVGAISLKAIYTTVDGDDNLAQLAVVNTGTGVKSPLYSQMTYNQNAISLDADTIVLGLGYDAGSIGKFAANYGMTSGGKSNRMRGTRTGDTDYNELDLVYKIKTGGVQYFATAVIRDIDAGGAMNTTVTTGAAGATDDTVIRFWARYNF